MPFASTPLTSPWIGLGSLLLTREWQSFSAIQSSSAYFRITSHVFTDWNYLESQGGGWLYFRQKLIDSDNPNSIIGITSENRIWLDPTPRLLQISEFPDFPDRIPEAFFLPRRRGLEVNKFPRVEIEMLTYNPPSQAVQTFPDPANTIPPYSDLFLHEEIIIPAGRGTESAVKAGYSISYYSGIFVNTSGNTCWVYLQTTGLPAPSKNTVIDEGIRINQNGSTFVIPEHTQADIYFATSSLNELTVRGFYYGRNI